MGPSLFWICRITDVAVENTVETVGNQRSEIGWIF